MISIITPVYNAEKFISSMIDSVLVQTYQETVHFANQKVTLSPLPIAMIGLNQPFLSGSFKR